MKIGIFDSGLGGLIITKALVKKMPKYDFVYLGDTKRVPYGNRSQKIVYKFLEEAVNFLFNKNCKIIIVACNTASAKALRKIQKNYLPKNYPDRKVLGVLIPAVEEALMYNPKKIGVLATEGTVNSGAFEREIKKLNKDIKIIATPAPLLVPLIENNEIKNINPILQKYLKNFISEKVDCIILGCTHYPIIKKQIKQIIGIKTKIISQDEIISKKLVDYLKKHKEIDSKLSKSGKNEFFVTEITENYITLAKKWFGKNAKLKLVKLK